MTETPALKPCPFCGGEAKGERLFSTSGKSSTFYIGCSNDDCWAEVSTSHPDEAEATAAWNKRSVGSSAPLSAWLPIESAPKDGTKILAFVRGKGWDVMRYHIPANPDARQFWIGSYLIQPTHWMPLPSAPVGSEASDNPPASMRPNPSLAPVSEEVVEEVATDIVALIYDVPERKWSDVATYEKIRMRKIARAAITSYHKALKGGGRDGVIEECAKVADEFVAFADSVSRPTNVDRLTASDIAHCIRSLKSPPGPALPFDLLKFAHDKWEES